MSDEKKNKLIDLGTDVLAEVLLKLAGHGDRAGLLVKIDAHLSRCKQY